MHQATCQNCKEVFAIDAADQAFYAKIEVPLPTFCPDCRFQRRASWINTRNLYLREIPHVGKTVSMYSQDKKLNIIADEEWWSDTYDFLNHGKEYDVEKPMFSQFHDLLISIPLPHLQRGYATFENSDYCNAALGLKNCYLVINADNCEDCMYSWNIQECKTCLDLCYVNRSELCYEGAHLLNCYRCFFSDECEDSSNLLWCRDCISCKDCIGCIGLRHKSFHIFNKPYTQDEYRKKVITMNVGSYAGQQKVCAEAETFFLTRPHKATHGRNNEDVSGDFLYQCKNVTNSFLVKKAEGCRYLQFLQYLDAPTRSSYDYTMFGVGSELMYEDAWCGVGCHNVKFSFWNYGSSDIEYCFGCHYSTNLFACIGLRHKKFCIFNKQYTESEYHDLVKKVKKHMIDVPYIDANKNEYRYGDFFPIELSPFSYNQTLAQEFCPLTKKEAVLRSYGWHDSHEPKTGDVLHWSKVPDSILDASDDLAGTPILCKAYEENPGKALEHHCSQYFKIIPKELALYKTMGIALPRYCQNSRHHQRLKSIRKLQMWDRKCDKCRKGIRTMYAPNKPEIVYCEECYLAEVY